MPHFGAKRTGAKKLPRSQALSKRIGHTSPLCAVLVLMAAANANAQFTATPGSPIAAGSAPHSMAVADLKGDGKLGFVTANSAADNVTVMLGNGSGGFFQAVGSPFGVGNNPQSVAVGDFNGDGKPDIVTANFAGNNLTVLLGNGSGGFAAAPGSPFAVGVSPIFVAVGDFNGDGQVDIVTANSGDNTVTLLMGDGSGGFTAATGGPFAVGTNPVSIAVGDFNRDGKLDIVIANAGDNTVTELLGDGASGFASATGSPFAVGANPSSIAAGDFNNDGKLDIVTANFGDNTVTELLGDGSGGFAPALGSPFAVGTNPQSVATGDSMGMAISTWSPPMRAITL